MAITQISKMQVRVGNVDNLPQLYPGEIGYAIDAKRVYVGNQPVIGVSPTPDNTEILTALSQIPAGGSNNQVQFNNGGNIGGTPGATYDFNANVLNVTNLAVSSNVTLTPNITVNTLALTASDTTVAFKLPINIGGTTYYICLTQAQ